MGDSWVMIPTRPGEEKLRGNGVCDCCSTTQSTVIQSYQGFTMTHPSVGNNGNTYHESYQLRTSKAWRGTNAVEIYPLPGPPKHSKATEEDKAVAQDLDYSHRLRVLKSCMEVAGAMDPGDMWLVMRFHFVPSLLYDLVRSSYLRSFSLTALSFTDDPIVCAIGR